MKRKVRKLIALLVIGVMLLSGIPAYAADDFQNTWSNRGDQAADIVGIARTQIGYAAPPEGLSKYNVWYYGSDTENPFTDIKPIAYYYQAVIWGYQHGIVRGTSATTFSPNDEVTRAQFITFLYRYAEEPEPDQSEHSFTDVPEGTYYTDAVSWGSQTGVVAGMDHTHFGPTAFCTRGQVVTFLWRYSRTQQN